MGLFRNRFMENVRKRRSRTVLALDVMDINRAEEILEAVEDFISAVKINYPLFLSAGKDNIKRLIERFDLPFLGDFKIADIDATNRKIGEIMFSCGFDALIAHAFVGYEGGLDAIFTCAQERGRGVFLVVSMSHPGSREFMIGWQRMAEFSVEHGAEGIICPATRPEEVEAARRIVGHDILILSPGVGVQGGRAEKVIRAGADGIIVGRSIYESENPEETAKKLMVI